ncbi:WXG100 family type VII secretion target [Nocardia carnea]|uniref:ESAT-6-like protein n=1 Tax=Nocardia carnea TaxID=37328 RepID=A0ABW7TS58_9NOCA|nr:WXG100 family type VII secretion target [Nocardia carnea]
MSGQIQYSAEQMDMLANDLLAAKNRLSDTHLDLRGYVDQLAAEWGGTAKNEYLVKQGRWDDANGRLMEIMEKLSGIVRDGAVDMATTDAQLAAKWL